MIYTLSANFREFITLEEVIAFQTIKFPSAAKAMGPGQRQGFIKWACEIFCGTNCCFCKKRRKKEHYVILNITTVYTAKTNII